MQQSTVTVPWAGWKVTNVLGRGGFGAVYQIERDNFGSREYAAMKVISIPQNENDINDLYSDGFTAQTVSTRYESYMKEIVSEYALMAKLKGCANVVYCDDVYQEKHADGIGWDIFIRMELLTPLPQTLPTGYDEATALRLGTDMARALTICKEQNIVHRDVKPQNIFVAPDGTYKLGDFGVAKATERTTGGTKIGTYKYMAPEVYLSQPYGTSADVYSLGLVLYWFMNERRTPFAPLPPAVPTHTEEEQARARRFGGEPIPAPKNGSEALKKLVLRACAFDPAERISAEELLREMKELLRQEEAKSGSERRPITVAPIPASIGDDPEKTIDPDRIGAPEQIAVMPDRDPTIPPERLSEMKPEPAPQPKEKPEDPEATRRTVAERPQTIKEPAKPQKKKWIAIAVAACVALAVGVASIVLLSGGKNKSAPAAEVTPEQTAIEMGDAPTYLAQYDPASSMAQEHSAVRVKLDGVTYVLPCPVRAFLSNGWEIDYETSNDAGSDRDLENKMVAPGETETFVLLKNGKHDSSLFCSVKNGDEVPQNIWNCYISEIYITQDTVDLDIYDGITYGASLEQVHDAVQKLPTIAWGRWYVDEEQDFCSYEDYGRVEERTNDAIHFNFTDEDQLERITITADRWFWDGSIERRDPDVTAYAAPTALGDDLESGVVEIAGELYQLPCPVSAFLDNGWESYYDGKAEAAMESFLGPHDWSDKSTNSYVGDRSIYLVRGDVDCWLQLYIVNYANYPQHNKDCIVVGVHGGENSNGTVCNYVVLPGNIRIGETTDRVTANDADYPDIFTSESFYLWETDHQRIEVQMRKDNGVVFGVHAYNDDWILGYID